MKFITEIKNELVSGWKGLLLVLGIAILSRFLHSQISNPLFSKSISEVLIAVLLSLALGNILPLGKGVRLGAKFALHRLLRFGIILLGLRLSLQDVAATGLKALMLVLICISTALALAWLAGRLFKIPPRLAALIGVGTAICGNTAIIATAPVLQADEEEVSFAVATITLFGLIAVLLYPLIGHALGLSEHAFGLWAGTAVNDTSQVVAAGAIYGEAALDVATIVKLTRNTLMAPLIVLVGLVTTLRAGRPTGSQAQQSSRMDWRKLVPGFVIGFLVLSLVRTGGIALGLLPRDVADPGSLLGAAAFLQGVDQVSRFAILMALAGVGLNTNLASVRKLGFKPLLLGTCVASLLAMLSLVLILFTPLGT